VTKRVESHDEIVEQELLKSSLDVNRIPMDQAVDGPQPVRREGSTIIVPVVSEVFKGEKQSVVTEEIHITERQQQETVRTNVTLNSEVPQIERLDSAGNTVSSRPASNRPVQTNVVANRAISNEESPADDRMKLSGEPASILRGKRRPDTSLPATPSILTNRPKKTK
jgi:hypothetical protein